MALPIVIYCWVTAGHTAAELPMAATSWLFGLGHFSQNGYQWGSIAVGILILVGYAIVHGAIFSAVAHRFSLLRTPPETLGEGLAWGFISWLFFWYTLLPIAQGGAPFRMPGISSFEALPIYRLFVAPTWVFVAAFALLGIARLHPSGSRARWWSRPARRSSGASRRRCRRSCCPPTRTATDGDHEGAGLDASGVGEGEWVESPRARAHAHDCDMSRVIPPDERCSEPRAVGEADVEGASARAPRHRAANVRIFASGFGISTVTLTACASPDIRGLAEGMGELPQGPRLSVSPRRRLSARTPIRRRPSGRTMAS
jgi:hypothetical protein